MCLRVLLCSHATNTGLTSDNCPNRQTCGQIADLEPQHEFGFTVSTDAHPEFVRINARDAARMLLRQRANSQSPESLGLVEVTTSIEARLNSVRERLGRFEGQYIAPTGFEAHHYNVKRPKGIFEYNKLTAREPVFESVYRPGRVKTIHLSYDNDARNLEARAGVARRNKLTQTATQLKNIENALTEVLALLDS